MKKIFGLVFIYFFLTALFVFPQTNDSSFSFIFMTDIHVQYERNGDKGFLKAIENANKLKPDFILTGGDLVYDALGVSYERADSLFNLYNTMTKLFDMPVYNTIGNHDIYGWRPKSKADTSHPEYGKKIYENRIGKRFYSFTHKGVKFFIIDGIVKDTTAQGYKGYLDDEQIEWIKNELLITDKQTPIVISTHIPFITILSQTRGGSMYANTSELVINNSKEVLDLFAEYNLRLMLQGHLHYFEAINFNNQTLFLTGGAVSARWWRGKTEEGMEEGFVLIKYSNNNFEYEYIDYGWEVEN